MTKLSDHLGTWHGHDFDGPLPPRVGMLCVNCNLTVRLHADASETKGAEAKRVTNENTVLVMGDGINNIDVEWRDVIGVCPKKK